MWIFGLIAVALVMVAFSLGLGAFVVAHPLVVVGAIVLFGLLREGLGRFL